MDPSLAQLQQIVTAAFQSLLGVDLSIASQPPDQDGRRVVGCVQISGRWKGAVLVLCPDELARLVASNMFGMPAVEVTDDEIRDSIGELANIVAGNIKAHLPNDTTVSLPTVARGHDFSMDVRGAEELVSESFVCSGMLFGVCLVAKPDLPPPG